MMAAPPEDNSQCKYYSGNIRITHFVIGIKSVISYYNNNNTNVYACKLDASKAFDRVHYGTLFEILQKRRMPVIVIRLLLDMYTRQSTCILWNGSRSTVFDKKTELDRVEC